MSTRLAKQIVYGALYVILWVLVIWGGYKVFARPVAPPALTAPPQPVSIITTTVFATSANQATLLAKIANPNADLAAQEVDYAFNLRDA